MSSVSNTSACAPSPPGYEWEVAASVASTAMLLVYSGVWRLAVRRMPLRTTRGTMNGARRAWVEANMNAGMLPVNTLRDIIRSNQFFASSALVLAGVVVGFAHQSEDPLTEVVMVKLLCLCALEAANFVCFMHAVRYLCHTEILINTPHIDGVAVTPALVCCMLNHGTRMWSIGLKGMMLTMPLLLWLFGPLYLVLGTAALVGAWRALDWDDFGAMLPKDRLPLAQNAQAPLAPADAHAVSEGGVESV